MFKFDSIYAVAGWAVIGISVILITFIIIRGLRKVSVKTGNLTIEGEGAGEKEKRRDDVKQETAPVDPPKPPTPPIPELKVCTLEKPLTEHVFFQMMQMYIKRHIDLIEIENPLKKLVITTFLKIIFRFFHDRIRDYVDRCEMGIEEGGRVLMEDITRLIFDGIDAYNSMARQIRMEFEGRIINGIPECFIRSFDRWHSPHVEIACDGIAGIVNNELYPNETTKLLAIIELFNIVFRLTIDDAQKARDELNGQLEAELRWITGENGEKS